MNITILCGCATALSKKYVKTSATGADDTILHAFPNPEKDLDRFNKWIYAIGGNVLVINPNKVFKHGRVCHNHFDAKYYTSSRRLSKIAVPSLNIRGDSSIPQSPVQNRQANLNMGQAVDLQTVPSLQFPHQPIATTSTATQPLTVLINSQYR